MGAQHTFRAGKAQILNWTGMLDAEFFFIDFFSLLLQALRSRQSQVINFAVRHSRLFVHDVKIRKIIIEYRSSLGVIVLSET